MRRARARRAAGVLSGAALGLAIELGAPIVASATTANWTAQTLQSLGLTPQTVWVVVTRAYHLEDYRTAETAGIPTAHIVFADQWQTVPAGAGVVVLGGTAATAPGVSKELSAQGDLVVQLGGATYLQTAAMFRAFLAGTPLGELPGLANTEPARGPWTTSANPYAGQGQAFTNGIHIDGVSVAFLAPGAGTPAGPSSNPPSPSPAQPPPPPQPAPTSVSLVANPSTLAVGQVSLLTATAVPASNPSWAVNVVDTTSNVVVTTCVSAGPCVIGVSEPVATVQTFVADIGPPGALPDAPDVVVVSAPVPVTWYNPASFGGGGGGGAPPSPAVSLQAAPQLLWTGMATTLTATGSAVPQGDHLAISGTDGLQWQGPAVTTANAVYQTTDTRTTSGTVSYTPQILTSNGSAVAQGSSVSVTWEPPPTTQITANPTSMLFSDPSSNMTTTLTVSATDLLVGDKLLITGTGAFPYSVTTGAMTTPQATYQTTVQATYLAPPGGPAYETFIAQVLDANGNPVPGSASQSQQVEWYSS
ncbi:MAG: hypothetical protein K6U87_05800 [Firmicutes bacterium]|nr:hypothetical protein [Bacillota bacterium]